MLIPDAETPDGERIKILDFGIAKLDPTAQGLVRTRTNSMMGRLSIWPLSSAEA